MLLALAVGLLLGALVAGLVLRTRELPGPEVHAAAEPETGPSSVEVIDALPVAVAVLAADDPHQFAAVRAVRGKLDGYPTPTTWTGHLLHAPRPAGRLVVQNLGTGITDLVVAAAVVERAEASATGQVVDI